MNHTRIPRATPGRRCTRAAFMMALLFAPLLPVAAQTPIDREIHVEFQSPLLAKRGEARITDAEFDARMQAIPDGDQASVLADPERIGKLFEDMLATQAVAQDAIERKALDEPLIQAEMYRTIVVRLAEIQRTHIMESAELADYTQRARELYLAHPDQNQAEPTVSFTHLLVQDLGQNDAEARARELMTQVKQGESLTMLAQQYSDDPSSESNHGRFENTPVSQLDSKFRGGIAELEIGEVGIIESAYGWHLVRVDARAPARRKSFEEVADKLREQARVAHLTRVWEAYLRAVHEQELEIAPGGVAAILERYGVKSNSESD